MGSVHAGLFPVLIGDLAGGQLDWSLVTGSDILSYLKKKIVLIWISTMSSRGLCDLFEVND